MTDPMEQPGQQDDPRVMVVGPDGMPVGGDGSDDDQIPITDMVSRPDKVMRIGSMIKQLLDEVRAAPLDEASRERLAAIFDTSVQELAESLSPDLQAELARLAPRFSGDGTPSEPELRIAQAQLVGWLEGLFHGIQATLFAQQMAARAQLEDMRRQLPGGQPMPGQQMPDAGDRPGTYL